jgi:hypothetical protein
VSRTVSLRFGPRTSDYSRSEVRPKQRQFRLVLVIILVKLVIILVCNKRSGWAKARARSVPMHLPRVEDRSLAEPSVSARGEL